MWKENREWNEDFKDIVKGYYTDDYHKCWSTVATTDDDGVLLISLATFTSLNDKARSNRGEYINRYRSEFDNKYLSEDGEEIVKEYVANHEAEIAKNFLANHKLSDIFSDEEVSKLFSDAGLTQPVKADKHESALQNLGKAHEANKKKGDITQATIIGLVLSGNSKQRIENEYGYSHATVYKAFIGLTEDSFKDMWNHYRATVLSKVDPKAYVSFLECHCNYKEFMKKMDFNNRIAFNLKMDEIVEDKIKVIDTMQRLNDVLAELGHPAIGIEHNPKTGVEDTAPRTDGAATVDDILSMFNDTEPAPKPVAPVKVAEQPSNKVNPFVEKYSRKPVEQESREITSTYKGILPKVAKEAAKKEAAEKAKEAEKVEKTEKAPAQPTGNKTLDRVNEILNGTDWDNRKPQKKITGVEEEPEKDPRLAAYYERCERENEEKLRKQRELDEKIEAMSSSRKYEKSYVGDFGEEEE
jgi:hypothetical protein